MRPPRDWLNAGTVHARHGQHLSGRGGRAVGEHAQGPDPDAAILAGELAAADKADGAPADETDVAVKNGSALVFCRSPLVRRKERPPNSNAPASWRKKARVSGKKSENRVVFTSRTSRGASEKSGLTVTVPVRPA
jgi:hypothetical protein